MPVVGRSAYTLQNVETFQTLTLFKPFKLIKHFTTKEICELD
jgi:hypothetical protein